MSVLADPFRALQHFIVWASAFCVLVAIFSYNEKSIAWADDPLASLLGSSTVSDDLLDNLDFDSIKELGEVEIGTFIKIEKRVDRLYNFAPFSQVFLGERSLSNEIISTGADSSTVLEFDDGTSIAIGPNSEVMLDSFIYDPGTNTGNLSVSVLSGVTQFVSGSLPSESYSIDTPAGVGAIRGTTLLFFVEPDGEMHLGVIEGAVAFTTLTNGSDAEGETIQLSGSQVQAEELAANTKNFVSFRTELNGEFTGAVDEMPESFKDIEIIFEQPDVYSAFVSKYKTEQLADEILTNCSGSGDCSEAVQGLVAELEELGIETEDIASSLARIKNNFEQSISNSDALDDALEVLDKINDQVQIKIQLDQPSLEAESPSTPEDDTEDKLIIDAEEELTQLDLDAEESLPLDLTTDQLPEVVIQTGTLQSNLRFGLDYDFNDSSVYQPTSSAKSNDLISDLDSFSLGYSSTVPYYANMLGIDAGMLVGTSASEWNLLQVGDPIMEAQVSLRANGPFRSQMIFPATPLAGGKCIPNILGLIGDADEILEMPGHLEVSLGTETLFTLNAEGTLRTANSPPVDFKVVEYSCRGDNSNLGTIILEVTEWKTHAMNLELVLSTAVNGKNCDDPANATDVLCRNLSGSIKIKPISLLLRTAGN